jgi:hypothetical protein
MGHWCCSESFVGAVIVTDSCWNIVVLWRVAIWRVDACSSDQLCHRSNGVHHSVAIFGAWLFGASTHVQAISYATDRMVFIIKSQSLARQLSLCRVWYDASLHGSSFIDDVRSLISCFCLTLSLRRLWYGASWHGSSYINDARSERFKRNGEVPMLSFLMSCISC